VEFGYSVLLELIGRIVREWVAIVQGCIYPRQSWEAISPRMMSGLQD